MSNLTKKQREQIGGEIENQGLGYWVSQYGSFDGDDTQLEMLISKAKESYKNLDNYLIKHQITF